MSKQMPVWAKKASKRMIDLGINKRQLAEAICRNYQQVCNVMNGHVNNDSIELQICEYLRIER